MNERERERARQRMKEQAASWPHPALMSGGSQLDRVIRELEDGTMPRPADAIWRDDIPREQAVRLAKATGATDEQIAEITGQEGS